MVKIHKLQNKNALNIAKIDNILSKKHGHNLQLCLLRLNHMKITDKIYNTQKKQNRTIQD